MIGGRLVFPFTWSPVATTTSSPEYDYYRLVLICAHTGRILTEKTKDGLKLPQIRIPRWTRPAEQIQAVAENKWVTNIFIIDFHGEEHGHDNLVIAHTCGSTSGIRLHEGERWTLLESIDDSALLSPERTAVQNLIAGERSIRGPFFRLDWAAQLHQWVSVQRNSKEAQLTGEFKQFNAGASSALIRLARKSAPPLWFKAAPPTEIEGQATITLAREFPGYLPQLIAFHREWNGWLLEDAGPSLGALDVIEFSILDRIVRRLAQLQMVSVSKVGVLLASGLRDERLLILARRLRQIAPNVEEAMSKQPIAVLSTVSTARVNQISAILEQAHSRFRMYGMPDALIHTDMHLENILLGGRGIFTDWARAAIGNPFVTFYQLSVQLAQREETKQWLKPLRKSYQSMWRALISESAMTQIFAFVPAIAAASELCAFGDLWASTTTRRTEAQRYVRTLARRLNKEAELLAAIFPLSA